MCLLHSEDELMSLGCLTFVLVALGLGCYNCGGMEQGPFLLLRLPFIPASRLSLHDSSLGPLGSTALQPAHETSSATSNL